MSNATVITRFAPSPTGALHVGGARTALFNWAYARGRRGRFLLRSEDTDQKRSSEQSAQSILEDLQWLGIDWDNDPIPRQSERLDLYNAAIDRLLADGRAYEDDGAVRFRVDDDVTIDDAVYGRVEVKAENVEDFVIRKADGFPTFHLAVVVDDANMDITHVIRGQEHLSNTPKHVALIDALGYERPIFAHTPSIMNPDGSKMSKRDKAKVAREAARAFIHQRSKADLVQLLNATSVFPLETGHDLDLGKAVDTDDFLDNKTDHAIIVSNVAHALNLHLPEINVKDFRDSGYLPAALCNYLALLGWSPGGDVEKFDTAFLCERFDLDRINKSNAKFDRQKLLSFSGDAIAALPPAEFGHALTQHHPALVEQLGDRFALFAEAYQPRARTFNEPAQSGRFFLIADDEIEYDDKAVSKNLTKNDGEGLQLLGELRELLAAIDPWSGEKAHDAITQLSEDRELKMGKVAQPLRVAVSGGTVSPPIDITLEILGKDATLARIDRCLKECAS